MPTKELLLVAGAVWLGVCVVSVPEWSLEADADHMSQIMAANNADIQRQVVPVNRRE